MGSKSPEYSFNDSESCKSDSCSCSRCARTRKFQELLNLLTSASKKINYEEEISATVSMICNVQIRLYRYFS